MVFLIMTRSNCDKILMSQKGSEPTFAATQCRSCECQMGQMAAKRMVWMSTEPAAGQYARLILYSPLSPAAIFTKK